MRSVFAPQEFSIFSHTLFCLLRISHNSQSAISLNWRDIRASTIGLKSWTASGSNNIHADKVTVKKGLKKGTYKVKVMAKGSANYKASAWKTVTFKIRVR